MILETVLARQNKHWNGILYKELNYRSELDSLIRKSSTRHIQVLTGIRRSGKSSIFRLLINQLMKDKNPKSILFLTLDDPVFSTTWQNVLELNVIIETAEKISGQKVQYLFLDEIQAVNRWQNFVKSAYDSDLFRKIYITGSNSSLLKNDFSALLSGRYFVNTVRPYSFLERLKINGFTSLLDCINSKPKVLSLLDNCLEWGCFPEITNTEDEEVRTELLKNYFDSIIIKDCIVYNNIRDVILFKQLLLYIISNITNIYSYNSLGKALKSNDNTVKAYLEILNDSFILENICNFTYSLKASARSSQKSYCADNGFINALTYRFSGNRGKLLENFVFNELKKNDFDEVFFSNHEGECDFVAKKGNKYHGFQVCYELTEENRARELSGFKQMEKNITFDSKQIITYNQEIDSENVKIVPVWKRFGF